MPDKTQGELIRELPDMVIALIERVDYLRRNVDRHESELNRLTESFSALSNRVLLLEHQTAELQKKAEESGRRWWALLPSLLGAVVGGIIAFLGQLLVHYLQK